MFSLKSDITEKLKKNYDRSILNGLENGKYAIYFSYDHDNEIINYEACLRNITGDIPTYIKCGIMSTGEMVKDSSLELFIYIVSNDKKRKQVDEVGLEHDYSPIKEKIDNLIDLDQNKLQKRNLIRQNFSTFINKLFTYDTPLSESGGLLDLFPVVLLRSSSPNGILSLQVGLTKYYRIDSIRSFLDDLKNNRQVTYGDGAINLRLVYDAFNVTSRNLINNLSNIISGGLKDEINQDGIINLFKTRKGKIVAFSDLKDTRNMLKINVEEEEIEATINLNADGTISIFPDPKGMVFIGQYEGVYVDFSSLKGFILKFKNGMVKETYNFISQNPSFDFSQITDLMSKKFFPMMDGHINIDSSYREKYTDHSFLIKYFVDLNDSGSLYFDTVFSINNTEVTKLEAIEDFSRMKRIKAFEAIIHSMRLPENGWVNEKKVEEMFLTSDLSTLKKVCQINYGEGLRDKPSFALKPIKVKADLSTDWLEVSMTSDEYTQNELEDILKAYQDKKHFVRLKDKIIILNEESLKEYVSFYHEFNLDNKLNFTQKIPLYEIFNLSSFKNSLDLSVDSRISDIINSIKNYKDSTFSPTKKMLSIMRNYQLEGFKWLSTLRKFKLGGILADDMGLGKTLETIALCSTIESEMPILVISPKSVLYNWENEVKRWTDNLKCKVIHGTKSERLRSINSIKKDKKIIYCTSYDSIRSDIEEFKKHHFSLIILDEAQYIKNSSALKTLAVKELVGDTRFVLTGTPIENSLQDLWSIFDFLMPGYLFTKDVFQREFENMIVDEGDENAKKRLRAKIAPFVLRRTKEEVLKDLPEKTIFPLTVLMEDKQKKLYSSYLTKVRNSVGGSKGKIEILAALTRLRELCVDPKMFIEDFDEVPVKLAVSLSKIIEAVNTGHKVVVFSSFVQSLVHLKALLEEQNIVVNEIFGSTNAKDRLNAANDLNDKNGQTKVLLVSLKAGGTGLNLVGADIVIHLDPWWNLAAENQASDRTHRLGQTRPVTIFKIIAKGTIEEKVLILQEKKKELVDMVIKEGNNAISSLTDEDIKFLLS